MQKRTRCARTMPCIPRPCFQEQMGVSDECSECGTEWSVLSLTEQNRTEQNRTEQNRLPIYQNRVKYFVKFLWKKSSVTHQVPLVHTETILQHSQSCKTGNTIVPAPAHCYFTAGVLQWIERSSRAMAVSRVQ